MFIDLADVTGIGTEQRQMAIDAMNDLILASWNHLLFCLTISGWKKHIFVDRHDEHFCFDAP